MNLKLFKKIYKYFCLLIAIFKEICLFPLLRNESEIKYKLSYEKRFALLNELASKWGFQLYNKYSMWADDEDFWGLWKQFSEWKQSRAERKFVLWTLAKSVKGIAGDTVECGVFSGGGSFLISKVLCEGSDRVHHVFDSFEGLSEPSENDSPLSSVAPQWTKGDLSVPFDVVKTNLQDCKSIKFYPGWIPDEFIGVIDKKFVFVHIDVDLYEPTLESLKFFYERLVPGGVLLCDDYGSYWCSGARKAFDEFILTCEEQSVIHLPTQQGFIIKR